MPVQKIIAIKNRKYSLSLKNEWNYYIFYLIGAKIIKSGPWSQDIAYSLREIYKAHMSSREVWYAKVFEARTAQFYNMSLMTLTLLKD